MIELIAIGLLALVVMWQGRQIRTLRMAANHNVRAITAFAEGVQTSFDLLTSMVTEEKNNDET